MTCHCTAVDKRTLHTHVATFTLVGKHSDTVLFKTIDWCNSSGPEMNKYTWVWRRLFSGSFLCTTPACRVNQDLASLSCNLKDYNSPHGSNGTPCGCHPLPQLIFCQFFPPSMTMGLLTFYVVGWQSFHPYLICMSYKYHPHAIHEAPSSMAVMWGRLPPPVPSTHYTND